MPAPKPKPESKTSNGSRGQTSSGPNQKARILALALFLLVWSGAIAARLVDLQIIRYGELSQRAARQQQRSVEVAPGRGMIFDRNGQELAMTINVDSVYAVPSEVPDQAMAAGLLAKVMNVAPQEVLAKLESSRNFVWIARKLDNDDSARIRDLNLRGIYFQKESKRYYPKRDLAAQVLGYVGMDDEGLGGVERAYEDKLRGRPGKMLVSVDARQKSLGRVEVQPQPGSNVVLTLDEKIQYIAERELDRSMAETKAESGIVVVQNPATGEVLALAMRPGFNPNALRSSDPKTLKNRAVTDIYEPGSTFKIVTIAAALEEKLTVPSEIIDCQNGAINIFGRTIHDHKPFGNLTVSQVMQNSSDVGAIKLALRLGDRRMDQYLRAFGFGQQTGIELPGETRGMAKPVDRWTRSSIGSIAMGQEVGVSAVQLTSMVSAIANDGVYTPPRIVAGVVAPRSTPTSTTVVFQPAEQRRIISTLTAAELKRMLEDTVLLGTGKRAILDGYTSAGKTGTAQKVDPATRSYSKSKYIASFAGFAPVSRPAVTVYALLDSPLTGHHGADVAAPLFNRVTQQVLSYMNVPHDTAVKNPRRMQLLASAEKDDLSDGTSDRLDDAVEISQNSSELPALDTPPAESAPTREQKERARVIAASFTPSKAGSARPAASQVFVPEPAPAPPANGTVILDTEAGPVAPSFLGKSVRGAIEAAQSAGIEIDVIGSGVARGQSPAPGQRIPPGTRVMVRFEQ